MALDPLYSEYFNSSAPYAQRLPIGEMEKLFRRRAYGEFAYKFRALMTVVRNKNLQTFIEDDGAYFAKLFELWLKVLAKQTYQFAQGDETFFAINPTIVNLMAVTPVENGDATIKEIINHDNNLAKLLLLYTPRSRLEIPIKPLFDANPDLAGLWYSYLWGLADTYVNPVVRQNYQYFLENIDARVEPFDSDFICGYYRCTYVDNNLDRMLKRIYNAAIRRYTDAVRLNNRPNPKSIAVVTSYWRDTHAVYRAFAPYVEEMAREFDLTLVDVSSPGRMKPETSMFKHVRRVEANPQRIDVGNLLNNDFQLAYFPDMGMSQESVYLANMRIAPIQCMGTGHPVSSGCPNMDYFISGAEVETGDHPEENYDERLVLLPGLSVAPVKPRFTPTAYDYPSQFIINCPWMHMKNNADMAQGLRRIFDRAEKKVVFSIFPGCISAGNSSYMATVQDYLGHLPHDAFFIHQDHPYQRYMETLQVGRFTLHSYPFGGGTTAVDAFILGKPLVVFRGRHEYNRYSAVLLNRLGLGELVAESLDSYIDISVRLINDDTYLADITRRLKEADLDKLLFDIRNADGLKRAFAELIRHDKHFRQEKSRTPISIG